MTDTEILEDPYTSQLLPDDIIGADHHPHHLYHHYNVMTIIMTMTTRKRRSYRNYICIPPSISLKISSRMLLVILPADVMTIIIIIPRSVIGNSKSSSKRDLRADFKNSSRKSERVLSRVFKKVMIKE